MSCFGTSLIRLCPLTIGGNVALAGVINTDTDPGCQTIGQPIGPQVCAIVGTHVTIADITATGSRPLVIASSNQVIVEGKLDVSSQRGGQTGAGASFLVACATTGVGLDSANGGGGGAGGSFGGIAGNGANGGGGAAGGAATGVIDVAGVRGGCPGARGGNAGPASIGADSGGAVYLIAMVEITLTAGGHIYANGAGGRGALASAGGFGGGSGGLIGLDSPIITLSDGASVMANGGGGGEGGGATAGSTGHDGQDGTLGLNAALGGSGGTSSGGDGGAGTIGTKLDGSSGVNGAGTGAGGGGGGGAAGIVWVTAVPSGGMFSPPPQVH